MKKQEALHILGLQDPASDEDIKRAHRKKIVLNHPDKFAHDPALAAKAEEQTKLINEARDVLLTRKWEPDFGPTAAGWPYAGTGTQGSPYTGSPYSGSPFADFDLLEELLRQAQTGRTQTGQSTHFPGGFVYTVNFGGSPSTQSKQGSSSSKDYSTDSNPFSSSGFGNPFAGSTNPFSAFFQSVYEEQLSPKQRLDKKLASLNRHLRFLGLKLVSFAIMAFFGSLGPAIFLYTLVSLASYLRKERGISIALLTLILILFGPVFLSFMPKGLTPLDTPLFIAFGAALIYDISSLLRDFRTQYAHYRQLHKQSLIHFIRHLISL